MTKKFIVEVPTNVGVIGVIHVERKNRPEGLKRPYEYVLSIQKTKELLEALKQFENVPGLDDPIYVRTKPVSKGVRLQANLSGHPFWGNDRKDGISKKRWDELVKRLQQVLFDHLGPDAEMYVEPHSKERRFQTRFETYIMYEEMQ